MLSEEADTRISYLQTGVAQNERKQLADAR
jgi:hypothetical protein